MKRIALASLAVATVVALSGCTAIQRATQGDSTSDGASSFTYWSMWSEGEPQQLALQAAIDDFTKDTGIDVDVEWIGRDNVKKLSPTLNSPTSPADLVDAAQRNIKSVLVSTESSHSMNDVLASEIPGEDVTVKSVIPQAYLDMITVDGDTWMLPYQVISSAFWFNRAKHPDLVSDPPAEWDDLIAWLDASKAAGRTPLAQDGDIANFNLYYYAELAVRNMGAGELHAAAADPSGKAFSQQGFIDAAEQLQQLVDGGYFIDGYSSSKWPAMQQKWAQDQADLIFNGTWIPHETKESTTEGFEYGAFPMPKTSPDGDASQEVSLIGFGIPANAANAEAAEKFIAYFMKKDQLEGVSTLAGNMTPRTDIEVPAELADIKSLIDSADSVHGQFDLVIDDYGDWTTKVLIPLVNKLAFGTISAKDFSSQLPKDSATYWANNG